MTPHKESVEQKIGDSFRSNIENDSEMHSSIIASQRTVTLARTNTAKPPMINPFAIKSPVDTSTTMKQSPSSLVNFFIDSSTKMGVSNTESRIDTEIGKENSNTKRE